MAKKVIIKHGINKEKRTILKGKAAKKFLKETKGKVKVTEQGVIRNAGKAGKIVGRIGRNINKLSTPRKMALGAVGGAIGGFAIGIGVRGRKKDNTK